MPKKKVIILGCGITGATAAQEFTHSNYDVTILEKENRVGGKIHTRYDLNTELGAVIFFCNYPAVDTVLQKKLKVDKVLPGESKSINAILYGKETPTSYEKIRFATQLTYELAKYAIARTTFNEKTDTRNFYDFLKDNHCLHLAKFFECWVPGMGYGPLNMISTQRALQYSVLYPFNVLAMTTGLFGESIRHLTGGYQLLVEKMVEGYNVNTSVNVIDIARNQDGVSVTFQQPNKDQQTITADLLVLTMSPYHWPKLPMKLTELEKKCVRELRSVRYPVAICDIKGLPANQLFCPEALKKEGLGHVGFIHTNDKRENPPQGRRAVVYMNISPEDREFSLDEGMPGRQILLDDLRKLGFPNVTILATKDWEDYNPTLPMQTSEEVEKAQATHHTLYLGTYHSFETVAGAENSARKICQQYLKTTPLSLRKFLEATERAIHFFRHLPEASQEEVQNQQEQFYRPIRISSKL